MRKVKPVKAPFQKAIPYQPETVPLATSGRIDLAIPENQAVYDFINEYEPGSRITINNETNQQITGEEPITDFINQELHIKNTDKQTTLPVIIATSQHIIYADIRNRSYAV